MSDVVLHEVEAIYTENPAAPLVKMEAFSDDIVLGYLSDDAKLFEEEKAANGTVSTLTITKVFKGGLDEGDTFTLYEPYWFARDENGQIAMNYWMAYGPSEPGKEYLFFFHKANDNSAYGGLYAPITNVFSRFPAPTNRNQTFSGDNQSLPEQYNLIGIEYLEEYMEVYEDALTEYFTE